MVDGVHGYVSLVVRRVVVEYRTLLENVTIRDLRVEVMIAMVAASVKRNVTMFVVQVKGTMIMLSNACKSINNVYCFYNIRIAS